MTRFELWRAVSSPRWGIVASVAVLAAWLSESSVRAASFNAGAGAHAEDVVLALVNNLTLVGYLLLPAFALVATGTLAADRSSGFALLTLTRVGRKGRLWAAKVAAIVACALVAQALVAFTAYGVALSFGYASSARPSALSLVPDSEARTVLFAPARDGDDMRVRVGSALAYLALVFSAFGVAALAVSVVWNQESVPPALILGVVFFDWLIARFAHWQLYTWLSPTAHLLESRHVTTLSDALPWGVSVGYYALCFMGAVLGGGWLFVRGDV